MKKKYIIGIVIIALILIGIISFFIYNKIIEEGKKYEIEQVTNYNYFVLKENDKYGVIDTKGNTIIKPQYDEVKIPNPSKAVFVCYSGETSKAINQNSEQLFAQYNSVEPIRLKNISSDLMYEKSVLKYFDGTKYGLINFDGKEISKAIYEEIDGLSYKEGELQVKKDGKIGIINIKGNAIVPIKYDQVSVDNYYTDANNYKFAGYIVGITTNEGYRYGYLDSTGKEILKNEYNEISRVTEIQDDNNVYLICAKNGQYGINKGSKNILNNEYQSIRYDGDNQLFVIEKTKKYGVSDIDGNIIIPVEYSQIDITGMYVYAKNDQGTTVFDAKGKQAVINNNIAILKTQNDNYYIKINNEDGTKYGIVDKNEKEIVKENYSYIEYLYDNYFIVSGTDGKLGIIDVDENKKVDIIYDSVQKIQNTDLIQTTVSATKTTKVFSRQMEQVCEMSNATIVVEDNYIKVYNNDDTKYFNKQGKELKNTEVYSKNKLFVKNDNGKFGYVDSNENVKVDVVYDKANEFNEYGFAGIKKDGKWGVISEDGQVVIEPKYELSSTLDPSFVGKYYQVQYGFGEFYYTNR